MTVARSVRPAFWTCGLIALVSSLISAGYSLAWLFGPGAGDLFARYAASRSVALPLVILGVLAVGSGPAMLAMSITMALVQLFDAVIGFKAHDPTEIWGPLAIALLGLASATWLARRRRSALESPAV